MKSRRAWTPASVYRATFGRPPPRPECVYSDGTTPEQAFERGRQRALAGEKAGALPWGLVGMAAAQFFRGYSAGRAERAACAASTSSPTE